MTSKRLNLFEQLEWEFRPDRKRFMPPIKSGRLEASDYNADPVPISPVTEEVRLSATYFYPIRMSVEATPDEKHAAKVRGIEAIGRHLLSDLTDEIYDLVRWMDQQGYDRHVIERVHHLGQLTLGKPKDHPNDQ